LQEAVPDRCFSRRGRSGFPLLSRSSASSQTPPDQDFGTFFERRSLDYDRKRAILSKRADAAPVPEQCPAYQKSRAVIALQLIKRWRNLAYDKRHKNRRLPPSVLLAFAAS
jgi:hypothetical protein